LRLLIILCLGALFGVSHEKSDENSKFQILKESLLEERRKVQREHPFTRFLESLQEDSARFREDRGHISELTGTEILMRDGKKFVLLGVKLHPSAAPTDIINFETKHRQKLVRIRVDTKIPGRAIIYLQGIDLAQAGLEAGIFMLGDSSELTEGLYNAYRLSEQSAQSGLRGGWNW
jgi:hypothetical protein